MDEVIDAHKYLTLPRLSSQSMFNYLCPVSSNVRDKAYVQIFAIDSYFAVTVVVLLSFEYVHKEAQCS